MKAERTKLINKRHEERIREQIAKNKETSDKQIKNTEKIVELVQRSKENLEGNIEFKAEESKSHKRDQIIIMVLLGLYVGYICYTYLVQNTMTTTKFDSEQSL